MIKSILQTFQLLAEKEGITITALEKKIGASQGVLTRAIANETDIQAKWLLKLVENFPQYNPVWVLTGKGDPIIYNSDENYRESEEGESRKYPLVNQTAMGGFGSNSFSVQERDIKDYYVVPKFQHKQVDFMIEVEGSSMYPKYNSGDIVACRIIKESKFIQGNKTHVIGTKYQGILIKRIFENSESNSITLVSDNKDYPPFDVPKEEITGLALVVGVIRLE